MSNPDQLQTIDLAALAQVSGGATAAPTTDNDQIFTALNGILESIHSIAGQQRNTGGFNQQEMFMLMLILQQQNRSQVLPASSSPWSQEPIVRYY